MIVTHDQVTLTHWLCQRIDYTPTADMRCIGNVLNGKLVAVVGYDMYNGASIQMHVAGEGNWFTKDMLYAAFDYPFRVCKCNMVIGLVPSGNTAAIKFDKHIGFEVQLNLAGAHPDGSLLVMTMKKEQCRYLKRRSYHGVKEESTASA